MAVSEEIKYDFNHIKIGLIAFIADLELKLQKIIPDLPVFMLQTGDASYYLDNKFQEIENKEIYQKVPRFVIGFDEIHIQPEENSNQYNVFQYRKDDLNYNAKGRRITNIVSITTDFVSSNFVKALENYEIMLTITSRQNAFTYEFMGNTFEGSYVLSSNLIEKPGMDINSSTRNWSVKTPFDLQLHLLVPRIESIQKLSDTGFNTEYEIDTVKHDVEGHYILNPNAE